MATVIRGNSLYTIVEGPSWTEAEANSVALGGHLVTIEDEAENTWLAKVFRNDVYNAYIGLNDEAVEGEWRWSSGINSSFFNWNSNEPNNPGDTATSDYVLIHILSSHEWYGANGTWNDGENYGVNKGISEIPLTLSIDLPGTPTEGAGEFTTSINLSAGTEATGNLAEGATVYWSITGIDADDLASGALTGSGTITDGKLDIQHSLVQDDDKGEFFEVSVFSDESRTSEHQIGTIASVAIEEGTPDPITGILDLPGKVNLKNKGVTPFTLYGSDEIDVSKIDLATLGFGFDGDNLVAPSTKKNGSIHAAFEDVNQDGVLDLSVKVDTSSLASSAPNGTTQINAFGQYADGTELIFGLAAGDSVLFA